MSVSRLALPAGFTWRLLLALRRLLPALSSCEAHQSLRVGDRQLFSGQVAVRCAALLPCQRAQPSSLPTHANCAWLLGVSARFSPTAHAAWPLLPPAVWEVHEQVAVAAMECGCKELALKLVKNVHTRFPEGARGSRLTVRCAVLRLGCESSTPHVQPNHVPRFSTTHDAAPL